MRITQATGPDLAAARLDAVRTASEGEALVFRVPEEEPEAATRRAHGERDERDREREIGREKPSVEHRVEVSAWAAPMVAPTAAPPTRGTEERAPAALDREPRKASAVGDARPEGRQVAPPEAKRARPAEAPSTAATDGSVEGRPASERMGHEGAAGEAKARPADRLPEVEGAASSPATASDEAPTQAAVRAPAEAVASAAAQAAVETVVVPAGASEATAPLAVAAKGGSIEPRLPDVGAKGATESVSALPEVAGALPTVTQRQSDNGLTPVKASAPAVMAEGGDPLRSRLQDALRSSVNQRVLQQAASGEVVLPGLGRVAVTARAADSAVAVEVHAAQSATAQMLHARAGDIAADVLSADIPLSTLSFAGAGSWTRSEGHAPAPERDPSPRGPAADETSEGVAPRAIPAPAGRVRIVL